MADDWSQDRANPVAVGPPRRRMTRADRMRAARGRRKRRIAGGMALFMLIVVVVGAVFLGSRMWHTLFGTGNDYSGEGVNDVVIQVHDGDSTTAIAKTLQEHKVIATVKAFVDAAEGNTAISSIQPGYYKVRTEIPASNAVARLADPQNRVGKLVIPEGRQLDDIQDVKTNAVTDGIFSLISKATCVDLDGDQHCVSVRLAKTAAGAAAPSALSVPDWAIDPVTALGNDHRRLEGLIAPGTWNIDPSGVPQYILSTLIGTSATQYAQGGLLETAKALNMSPYQILIVGITGAARVQTARLREGRARHLQPTAREPHARIRLHGELPAGPAWRWPPPTPTERRTRRGTPMCDRDCPPRPSARPVGLRCGRRTARGGGLAVFRHHRHAGHHAVHPGLSTAPGEYRTGEAQRCPR